MFFMNGIGDLKTSIIETLKMQIDPEGIKNKLIEKAGDEAVGAINKKFVEEVGTQITDAINDKLGEKLGEYLSSMIPFLSSIPFLKPIMNFIITFILNMIIKLFMMIYNKYKFQLQRAFKSCLRLVESTLSQIKYKSLDYEPVLKKFDWIHKMYSFEFRNDIMNKSLYEYDDDAEEDYSNSVFKSTQMHLIIGQYNEVLNNKKDTTNAYFIFNYYKNVKIFNLKGYVMTANRLMIETGVFKALQHRYNIYSLADLEEVKRNDNRLI